MDKNIARERRDQSILLLPPLTQNPDLQKSCDALGKYYNIEVSRRTEGKVIYAKNIESLQKASNWKNLIKNGSVNTHEAATIADAVGCRSVITCQLLEVSQYPPFQMVILLLWIDSSSGKTFGKLYHDINLADTETRYKYGNYVGHNPAKFLYEQATYSEDLLQTALLSPDEFNRFVAAYSSEILLGGAQDYPWYLFWKSF